MEAKDWIAIAALTLGIGNTLWQVRVHREKQKRDEAQDLREAEQRRKQEYFRLEEKYLAIFKDHLGLPTWKAKAFEAFDAGLSPETVVSLLERVWVPFHKNPTGTQQEILDPILVELRGRQAKRKF
jgi:hypothetical protein